MKNVMKYFASVLGITIWLIITLILSISFVGLIAVLQDEYLYIPKKLLTTFD